MYYIYHIPNYKWKSGKIGKIGCTDELYIRMKKQDTTQYEVLETHSDIFIASNREIELQKQYGYPVDKIPYFKVIKMSSKGGKLGGNTNKESGHLENIRKMAAKANNKAIVQFDKNGNKIKEWSSGAQCAKELQISKQHISSVCKGKEKTAGGFIFKYKEQTHC